MPKHLKGTRYDHIQDIERVLQDYFPEYKEVERTSFQKGHEKYSWYSVLTIKYFETLYSITIKSFGNGGWLAHDDSGAIIVDIVRN